MPRDAKLIILVYFNRQPREMTNMALPFLFLNACAAPILAKSRCSARRRATVIEGRSRRGRTSLRAPPPMEGRRCRRLRAPRRRKPLFI